MRLSSRRSRGVARRHGGGQRGPDDLHGEDDDGRFHLGRCRGPALGSMLYADIVHSKKYIVYSNVVSSAHRYLVPSMSYVI